jgi:hypothetical protein
MSLTTTNKNNSLKLMSRPLPEIMQEQTDNVQDFKSVIEESVTSTTKPESEYPQIDFLFQEVSELMKTASWEFNPLELNKSSKYGREIDIYAVVGNNFETKSIDDYEEDEPNIYDLVEEYREHYKPPINITPLSVSVQSAKAKMTH